MSLKKVYLALIFVSIVFAALAHATTPACESLSTLTLPETTILSAEVVPADPNSGLPEYCNVAGFMHSTVGFEVRMPTSDWNGKLYFAPTRGFAGHIRFDTSEGLSRNYATVSTDTGHGNIYDGDIFDATWALNNRHAEIDYGYRAVHKTTIIGKKIIKTYYGSAASYSYLDGCSNGGRAALEEAERYPDDFDGIIAGSPVLDFTGLVTGFAWNSQAVHGTEVSWDIPFEKLTVIGDAVLAQCDAIDGLTDGLIDDPRQCNFDPDTLLCPGPDAPDCLTDTQVDALKKIYAGPSNSQGKQLYSGLPFGGETPDASFNGWGVWVVGCEDCGPTLQFILADQFLRYLAFNPDEPNFDINNFNFDTDPKRMKDAAEILNATSPDLKDFQKAGRKLILYQGWSDAAVAATRTINYFEKIQDKIGKSKTDKFARLFMAPGMYHCDSGPGPNFFDPLTALEQWVEQGEAPSSMEAIHFNDETGEPDRTRPLCPYPQVARYNGTGDINDAANFHCQQL